MPRRDPGSTGVTPLSWLTGPAPPGVRLGLVLGLAVLLASRIPNAFLKGRFWAEEGVVYFANAWTKPWPEALFAVHSGYLNLTASLATLLAADTMPLSRAPLLTTTIALLIQLCPAILLATSGVAWLRTGWALAAALLLLAAPPLTAEVWLNSITSQFHLTLCAALILALPTRAGLAAWLQGALLLLAGLSGPTAAFLVPLFAARWAIERSPARLLQGLLLGAAVLVQILVVLTHPEPGRPIGIEPRLLTLVVLVKHIILPILGPPAARLAAARMLAERMGGLVSWLGIATCLLTAGLFAFATVRARPRETIWLFAGGVLVMLLSYTGALGDHIQLLGAGFGHRYAFVPTVLFGLALVSLAATSDRWWRAVAGALVAAQIVVGAAGYFQSGAFFTQGTAWPDEVAHWSTDASYLARFWPAGGDWRLWLGPDNTKR